MTTKEIENCTVNPREYLENNGYSPLFTNRTKSVLHHAACYISGLITLPRGSNMSRIAENVPGCGTCRDLSHFISSSPWDSTDVMRLTRFNAIELLGPGGSIIFDESGQQKLWTRLGWYIYPVLGNSRPYLYCTGWSFCFVLFRFSLCFD